MKTTHLFVLFILEFVFLSCVDEYDLPKDIDSIYKQELVIEGRILSGEESVFYVTRTIPLTSSMKSDNVTNALITIIGQNGYESQPAEFIEDAKYALKTEELNSNTLYAVRIVVDGEIYQSNFQPLLNSPDIDEVTWKEYEGGISLYVSTHNDNENTRCYMWTYEEDWEFHAEMDIKNTTAIPLYNEKFYPMEGRNNPYYYCWGKQHSSLLYIYSTEDLSGNFVRDKELIKIPIDDVRISYIYSMLVKQWVITSEAYEYYRLMKLYTAESNGLFTPMPSDVRGNIVCTSTPEKKVRGFVIASDIKQKRIFIYSADLKLNKSEYTNCLVQIPDLNNKYWKEGWYNLINTAGFVALTMDGSLTEGSMLYSGECVDCRKTKGASKERPDFWPNDHQ